MSGKLISNDDLDWRAFRYAAGELSAEELNTFEELLATDDRACMAVARAVQLSQAVTLCERSSTTVVQGADSSTEVIGPAVRHRSRSIVAACTVALSLMFVVWVVQRVPQQRHSPATTSAVAALWIDGADEENATEAVLPGLDSDDVADEEPVPEWLLAALSEQQATSDDKAIMQD